MKLTILSKNYGSQVIDTENFDAWFASASSTIFQIVEHIWNEWFTHNTQPGAPMSKDIQGMYYGECDQPAIYSKKGAIRQGIENIIEYVTESEKPSMVLNTRDILKIDVESAFI
jgi:hypothetical protein